MSHLLAIEEAAVCCSLIFILPVSGAALPRVLGGPQARARREGGKRVTQFKSDKSEEGDNENLLIHLITTTTSDVYLISEGSFGAQSQS